MARIRKQTKAGLGVLVARAMKFMQGLTSTERVFLYLLTTSENRKDGSRFSYVSDSNIEGNLKLSESDREYAINFLENKGHLQPVTQKNKFGEDVDGWIVIVGTTPLTENRILTTEDSQLTTLNPLPTTLRPAGNQQVTCRQPAGNVQGSEPTVPIYGPGDKAIADSYKTEIGPTHAELLEQARALVKKSREKLS